MKRTQIYRWLMILIVGYVLFDWLIGGHNGGFIPMTPSQAYAQAFPLRPPKIAPIAINFSSIGANTVVAGIAGQSICVFGMQFVTAGTTNITFQDTGSGVFSGPEAMLANGSNTLPLRELTQVPYYVTTPGNGFVINNSAAVQVSGSLWYAPCL